MRVLTWGGGGGGEAESDFVAVGKEGLLLVVRTFDGLEEDGGPLGIRFLLPLFLSFANLLGEGVNLAIEFLQSLVDVHLAGVLIVNDTNNDVRRVFVSLRSVPL